MVNHLMTKDSIERFFFKALSGLNWPTPEQYAESHMHGKDRLPFVIARRIKKAVHQLERKGKEEPSNDLTKGGAS